MGSCPDTDIDPTWDLGDIINFSRSLTNNFVIFFMTYTTFLDQSQSKVIQISKYLSITKSQTLLPIIISSFVYKLNNLTTKEHMIPSIAFERKNTKNNFLFCLNPAIASSLYARPVP